MTLSRNIANLRYIHIYQDRVRYDIKLDVSNEYPQHLKVYYVKTNGKQNYNDPDDIKYGTLEGPPDKVSSIKQNLIHELEISK